LRFTLDSNVLVYSLDRLDQERHAIAVDVVARAATRDAFLTTQSIGECLNVVRRKRLASFDEARRQAERWIEAFEIVDTSGILLPIAAVFAERHRLQLWDAVLWQVARSAGADVLLSEDFQDGLSLEGIRVVNPFEARNESRLSTLLSAGDTDAES
jgi:predicted nucleic acid-binding protein